MPKQDPDLEIRERLEEEAVAWLARLTSGEATEPERARFRGWYARSPAHARAFDVVAGVWQGLEAVFVPRRARTRPRAPTWVRGLAVLGALSALLLLAYFPDVLRQPFHDYATAIGQQRSVRLPDGSLAQLNTDTTLDLYFNPDQRRVVLNRGEAAFEVAKEQRPFRVEAGTVRTEVLGTEFLLRYDGESGTVTLIEGQVRVTVADTTSGPERAALRLAPGQAVGFSRTGVGSAQPAPPQRPQPGGVAAW
ncbi:MAG: FecR family protein [Gammaproteobacteria bacterium]